MRVIAEFERAVLDAELTGVVLKLESRSLQLLTGSLWLLIAQLLLLLLCLGGQFLCTHGGAGDDVGKPVA